MIGQEEDDSEDLKKTEVGRDWKGWLKEPTFYIHGFVYMLVRISVNVTMTVQPFYLQCVTGFGLPDKDAPCKSEGEGDDSNPTPIELALVPLISYILSLIFSVWI